MSYYWYMDGCSVDVQYMGVQLMIYGCPMDALWISVDVPCNDNIIRDP
jgi:hypothetical protein